MTTTPGTITFTRSKPVQVPLTDEQIWPYIGLEDTCPYCGTAQTDEQAEDRTVEHIARDLATVHRIREALRTEFGFEAPGYDDDVYDLLCELDTVTRQAPALAEATTQP